MFVGMYFVFWCFGDWVCLCGGGAGGVLCTRGTIKRGLKIIWMDKKRKRYRRFSSDFACLKYRILVNHTALELGVIIKVMLQGEDVFW